MTKLKSYLKETAQKIRELKPTRKLKNRGERSLWEIVCELDELRYLYRHHHIAYCELRGRTREQIEKPAEKNFPNEDKINEIKEAFREEYVRASA